MTENFSIYIPFSKVEEQPDGTLMVWGRATQEILDSQGEILDYETSVPNFKRRSQEISDRSGGENLFPLRAMHQPIAAGKVVQLDFNDPEKAIDICSQVVDPVEIQKVKAHVYTGNSVGGRYKRRWPDPTGRGMRYTADPLEISLVDAPAVPTAKLTLFKIDEGANSDEVPEWAKELQKEIHEFLEVKKEEKKAVQEAIDQQENKLKKLGESVKIERRDGSPLFAPTGYPEDSAEYADPANWDFPCDESRAVKSMGRFNGGQGAEKYSSRGHHVLGRRIASLASRFGEKYLYDPSLKKVHRKEEKNMGDQVNKLDVGAFIQQVKAAQAMAADLASKAAMMEPAAYKDAVSALAGHLDNLAEQSTTMSTSGDVPATDPSAAIKAAANLHPGTKPPETLPSSPSSPSTPTTPTLPAAAKAADPKPAADSSPSSSPATPSTPTPTTPAKKTDDTDAYKAQEMQALNEKVDKLASVIEKLANIKSQTPAGDSPIHNLNALVDKRTLPAELDNPIIKALEEGGPYAMPKALKAAGIDDEFVGSMAFAKVNEAIKAASYASLEQGGIITKSRYVGRIYSPPAPAS